MVFPGIVRRLIKLMPTLVQAVALVVFIHIVGQVHIRLFKYIAVSLLNLLFIEIKTAVIIIILFSGSFVSVWECKV